MPVKIGSIKTLRIVGIVGLIIPKIIVKIVLIIQNVIIMIALCFVGVLLCGKISNNKTNRLIIVIVPENNKSMVLNDIVSKVLSMMVIEIKSIYLVIEEL